MVDLISTRTMDLTKFALDGLLTRQKAISANTANVMTPGYQRKEVSFENQLQEMVDKDDLKSYIKGQNSIEYNPSSLDLALGTQQASAAGVNSRGLSPQQAQYLQSNVYDGYNPQIVDDIVSGSDETGNNVNIEQESMDMAATGMKYSALSTLEQKQMSMIRSAIKGDMV